MRRLATQTQQTTHQSHGNCPTAAWYFHQGLPPMQLPTAAAHCQSTAVKAAVMLTALATAAQLPLMSAFAVRQARPAAIITSVLLVAINTGWLMATPATTAMYWGVPSVLQPQLLPLILVTASAAAFTPFKSEYCTSHCNTSMECCSILHAVLSACNVG